MLTITVRKTGHALRVACSILAIAACGMPLPAAAQQTGDATIARAEAGPVEGYFQDSLVTARVKLALLDAPDVNALDVGVRTHRGVVQLSGFVDDERLVSRAAEIATRVEGVVAVRNALQVKG